MRPGRGIFCPFRVNPRIFFHLLSYPLPIRIFLLLSSILSRPVPVFLHPAAVLYVRPFVCLSYPPLSLSPFISVSIHRHDIFFLCLKNVKNYLPRSSDLRKFLRDRELIFLQPRELSGRKRSSVIYFRIVLCSLSSVFLRKESKDFDETRFRLSLSMFDQSTRP